MFWALRYIPKLSFQLRKFVQHALNYKFHVYARKNDTANAKVAVT